MVALGTGGVKAALPAYGADQFDEKDPKEAKEMSTFFNWFLLAVCVGGVASLTLIVWVQDNKGWDKGFAISALAMFLGILAFVLGLPWHRIHVIQGNIAIVEIIQVRIFVS